jgi:hypothetical protein
MDGENHLLLTNSDRAKLPRHPKELGKNEFVNMAIDVKYTPCTQLLSKEFLRHYNLNMLLNNKGERMKTHRMVRFSKTLSLIMAFGLLATTSSMSLAETDRSLYERLGGYDAIQPSSLSF